MVCSLQIDRFLWKEVWRVKACSKCKRIKPFEAFGTNNQQTSGLQPSCKECAAALAKGRRKKVTVEDSIEITCTTCKINKLATLFPIDRNAKYGRRPNCKACESIRKREQYLDLRLSKRNTAPVPRGCEICGCKFHTDAKKGEKEKNTPHWDHVHETEIFRGWLCHNCNSALGQFGENIRIVEKAVEYMRIRGASPTRPLIK